VSVSGVVAVSGLVVTHFLVRSVARFARENRLDQALSLTVVVEVLMSSLGQFIVVLAVVGAVGLSMARSLPGLLSVSAEVRVLVLVTMFAVHVTGLASMERLVMLLARGLFDDEVHRLVNVLVVRKIDVMVLNDLIAALVLKRSPLYFDFVVLREDVSFLLMVVGVLRDDLRQRQMGVEVRVQVLTVLLSVMSVAQVSVLAIVVVEVGLVVRVRLGVVEGFEDGMLVEVDGLDVVLVVISVVQLVVGWVVRRNVRVSVSVEAMLVVREREVVLLLAIALATVRRDVHGEGVTVVAHERSREVLILVSLDLERL